MTRVRTLPTGVLVVFAVVVAAFAGALIGQINFADADVTSGDKPVNVNVDTFRIRDTRSTFGGPIGGPAAKLGTTATEVIQIAGTNGIPTSATAVCVNVTVLDATTESFVTVYGPDPRPNASTVNPTPGGTFFNGVIVPLDTNGALRVYNNAGSVNYFLDISCYYDDHNHDDRYYTVDQVDSRIGGGTDAVTHSGFEVIINTNNGEQVIAQNGPLTLKAVCQLNSGGSDIIRFVATSTQPFMTTQSAGIQPAGTEVTIVTRSVATGNVLTTNDIDNGAVTDPSGRYIGQDGETLQLALNVSGNRCYARGVVTSLPAVRP